MKLPQPCFYKPDRYLRVFRHICGALTLLPVLCFGAADAQRRPIPQNPKKMASTVTVGRVAPPFSLEDLGGRRRALRDYRGRRVALFFFCGCNRCSETARLWAQWLKNSSATALPTTLIVYMGDKKELQALAEESGLSAEMAALMIDKRREIAHKYSAADCPRVFVVDGGGIVRHIDGWKKEAEGISPAESLFARVAGALQTKEVPNRAKAKP